MAEGQSHHVFQDSWFKYGDNCMMNNDHSEKCTTSSSLSNSFNRNPIILDESSSSISSSDSEDDLSSSPSPSPSNSSRALYDLSEIMAQLPIKRGLSKFYKGKSESYTSLSRVTSIEDLAKRSRKVKAFLPKAIISKKSKKGSLLPSKRRRLMSNGTPLTPLHKNLECQGKCFR
ncbi:hypothetical protein BUALT_Bualt02G0118600 [Buddleja alternifolia]|uniref:Oxidative stress 3 n=1 Tax=Buddleja alternifolia TaxID=168488 RepID=A0AAV6Y834_9LAMI|nr:hypothetical protein BUALT_Bualt02G0118600 [Buddleja alternifolia]